MQETRHKDYPLPPNILQDHAMQQRLNTKNELYTVPGVAGPASPEAISVLFQTARVVELEEKLYAAEKAKAAAISAQNDLGGIQRAALNIALPGRVSSPHQSRPDPLHRDGRREYTPQETWAGWDILKDGGSPLTKELAELYANGLQRVATAELVGVRGILAAAGVQLL